MTKPRYIDFHNHSTYSDGSGYPALVVKEARLRDLDVIALTDHDMIEGIPEARQAAKKWGMRFVPGIEISTDRYHILGLGIDIDNQQFREFVRFSESEQSKVCQARVNVLKDKGIPITFEKVLRAFPNSRLGKYNLFMALIQDEECQEYFQRNGGRLTEPYYKELLKDKTGKEIADKLTCINPERAIREIHQANGLAFIAHPFKQVKDMEELEKLRSYGIDGLEVQPNFNGRNDAFEQYAKDNDWLVTYGSDYHGGAFDRLMLRQGKNVLSPELEKALRL